jgi:2-oxoglutarate dehydrogenase E2 component (dihydrolipoamide succinyltransferase)
MLISKTHSVLKKRSIQQTCWNGRKLQSFSRNSSFFALVPKSLAYKTFQQHIHSTPLKISVPSMKHSFSQVGFSRLFSTASIKTIKVPGMGDSISEGVIKKWNKNVGEFAQVDDLVASIETDKVVVEIRAPESGVITEHCFPENQTISVGSDLFKIDTSAKAGTAPKVEPPKAETLKVETPKVEATKAETTKAETTKAETTKVETSKIAPQKPEIPKNIPVKEVSTPITTFGNRTETRQKMSRMRLRIAERLKDSQNTYALLTTFNEIDMSNITSLRNQYKEEFEKKHGVKLGFMSAFVKAAVSALQEQPNVNAVIDGDEIVYRNYFDVSVAVATPNGLVVPVLRNCDQLSFAGVEKNLSELGKKARDGKLALEDMAGGTFTISNGGVYGSMMGTPIVNPPQSAILGMHAVKNRAVVIDDQIVIRPVMYIALTYDHRLIDGKEAVTFLKKIKEVVEDPRRLLLEL